MTEALGESGAEVTVILHPTAHSSQFRQRRAEQMLLLERLDSSCSGQEGNYGINVLWLSFSFVADKPVNNGCNSHQQQHILHSPSSEIYTINPTVKGFSIN